MNNEASDRGSFKGLLEENTARKRDLLHIFRRSISLQPLRDWRAAGLALQGTAWGRQDDTFAVAAVVNAISDSARGYFAAGGLGVLIGDGRLNYGTENVLETYYSANVTAWLRATFDYQFALHPAYNRDRGPVSIYGIRAHAEF